MPNKNHIGLYRHWQTGHKEVRENSWWTVYFLDHLWVFIGSLRLIRPETGEKSETFPWPIWIPTQRVLEAKIWKFSEILKVTGNFYIVNFFLALGSFTTISSDDSLEVVSLTSKYTPKYKFENSVKLYSGCQ